MRFDHFASEFERRDCLLPTDRRKALQEVVDRVPCLEVIVERLYWHACADKDWRAAQDVRITVYDRRRHDCDLRPSIAEPLGCSPWRQLAIDANQLTERPRLKRAAASLIRRFSVGDLP